MFVASEVAADVEESKVLLTFRAPRVTSTMRYRINGALFETFPLVGGGVCDVAYNDVTISAVAQLRGSNGKFQFADFEDPNVDYGSDEVTVSAYPLVSAAHVPTKERAIEKKTSILFSTLFCIECFS